jgi:hypothetical protein
MWRSVSPWEEGDAVGAADDGGGGGGGGGGDNAVVAFVVPVDGGALTSAAVGEIRTWLAQRLPPAAVPTRVVGVEVGRCMLAVSISVLTVSISVLTVSISVLTLSISVLTVSISGYSFCA